MRIQIVTDEGEVVYSAGKPIAADLTRILEREIVRREVGMAKLLRNHLEASAADTAARETRMAVEFKGELFDLKLEHRAEMDAVKELLEGQKVDVSWWRPFRYERERLFAERIDAVLEELVEMTKRGSG
jgi:hypothetical protein